MGPSTPRGVKSIDVLVGKGGGAQGKTKIVIVSPAFLADGLETLEELDIEIREHFIKHGGKELRVVNCLNDDPIWIQGLGGLVKDSFRAFVPSDSVS